MSEPPKRPTYAEPKVEGDAPGSEAHARTLKRLESLQNQLARKRKGDRLDGKVCIITGVGSKKGIGRASAFAFAHEGAAHLYLLDYLGDSLPELEKRLMEAYPRTKITVVEGDATDDATIASLCRRAIADEGRLDVFFANAGIATILKIPEITPEFLMRTIRVNTLSCFLAIKHASEAMLIKSSTKGESGGSIIMTASTAGLRASSGSVDYSASKATVNSMAKTAACQLAGTNIRVNSVCPGLVETGMTTIMFENAKARGKTVKVGQLTPLQRHGVPEEIAQLALFLASDDSSYVNAQNIAIDGGLSGSHPVTPGRSW
ncbi:hypothetical protein FRB94_004050 [Tulasnella sp. JGI-2019a]|nr:hypothetical protein FRB94_004050 [Tulasnella sp. JGI-2019a]KAG9010377.1 hypothetical protein FRB93_004217 [Tulasnella sp. JGI-2019a]